MLLHERVWRHLLRQIVADGRLEAIVAEIMARRSDPYSASEAMTLKILGPLAST